MLVSTMNHQEITKEILKETEIFFNSSTITRLTAEYFIERKKNKIKKDADYPRFYDLKTKAKNHWSIMLTKDHELPFYNSPYEFDIRFFTHYYSDKGIRVFESNPEEIVVHNQHFFSRYRERMNLNILNILDVVKLYHKRNHDPKYSYMDEVDGRSKFVAILDDGFAMGEFIVADNWIINKTFLPKSAPDAKMSKIERMMISALTDYMSRLDKSKHKDRYAEMTRLLESLLLFE